ncbi:MAG: EcsC family protein [Myxococcota bacterium]
MTQGEDIPRTSLTPSAPSPYEETAIHAIHAWRNPSVGWLRWSFGVLTAPIDLVGRLVLKIPGLNWIIANVLGGLLGMLNDGAAWTVRQKAILRGLDPPAERLTDVHRRDLEEIDAAVGFLAAKYKLLAAGDGAIAGATSNLGPVVSVPAIALDITTLLALNLRAIAEYATYYGFDIRLQEERLFALELLTMTNSTTEQGKMLAMAQLVHIAKEVAQQKTWKELERHAFVQIMQRLAKSLAIRLTKAKLAQLLPVAGAVVGGGYNAYYTGSVCRHAHMWYRERFLARKYGADVIQAVVVPAGSMKARP